jgi:hypothetical protein
MRRRATWLLLCAVAGLGLAAAVDAFRGPSSEGAGRPPTSSPTRTPSVEVTADELRGVLYYTDEDCRIRGIELPELTPVSPRIEWNECAFSLAPSGNWASAAGTTWHANSSTWAFESEGSIVFAAQDEFFSFEGSAPAFGRSSSLAFFRDGEVRVLEPACVRAGPGTWAGRNEVDRCSRTLLRAADLRRAARKHPNTPESARFLRSVRVQEAAWLDQERLVVLLALDIRFVGRYEEIAVFEGPRIVEVIVGLGARFSGLRVSPRGRYFGVRTENPEGILLFDRDGGTLTLPFGLQPHAFAWSPGESWTAVAARGSVYVFRTGNPPLRVRRLGITAADLAWR